jgi:hypothetical protein
MNETSQRLSSGMFRVYLEVFVDVAKLLVVATSSIALSAGFVAAGTPAMASNGTVMLMSSSPDIGSVTPAVTYTLYRTYAGLTQTAFNACFTEGERLTTSHLIAGFECRSNAAKLRTELWVVWR